MFPGNSLSSKAINNKCKNERKKKKKQAKNPHLMQKNLFSNTATVTVSLL